MRFNYLLFVIVCNIGEFFSPLSIDRIFKTLKKKIKLFSVYTIIKLFSTKPASLLIFHVIKYSESKSIDLRTRFIRFLLGI